MPDVNGWEDSRESSQQLLSILYNKDKEKEWRMDVNVELCEAYDSDNDDCDDSDYESSSYDNEMSQEKEDSDDIKEGLSDVSESEDRNSRSSDE